MLELNSAIKTKTVFKGEIGSCD